MRPHKWLGGFLLILLGWGLPQAYALVEIQQVHVGWDGVYKRMRWLPVDVQLRVEGESFQGTLGVEFVDPYSEATLWRVEQPLEMALVAYRRIRFRAFAHWVEAKLRCELRDAQGQTRARFEKLLPQPLRDTTLVVGIVATDRSGLQALGAAGERIGAEVRLVYLRPEDLTRAARDYAVLDALVLREIDMPGALSPEQTQALLDWIAEGGAYLSVAEREPRVLREWLPLASFKRYESAIPLVSERQLRVKTNQWIGGKAKPTAAVWVRLRGIPVVAAQDLARGRVIFLGVSPQRIVAGWEFVLRGLQTKAQRHRAQMPLREHERRFHALLIRERTGEEPLSRRVGWVGGLTLGGLLLLGGVRRIRPYRLWVALLWCLLLASGTSLFAWLRSPQVESQGFAWCEAYPSVQRMTVHLAAGLRVSQATQVSLRYDPAWALRPLQWPRPLGVSYHRRSPDSEQMRLRLSPWRPFPILLERMQPFPHRVVLRGDTLQSLLPFPLQDAYLLAERGWGSVGELPPGGARRVSWRPHGDWRLPGAASPRRVNFLRVLFQENVIALGSTHPLLLGWVDLSDLALESLPIQVTGDAFLVIHLEAIED